MIQSKSTIHHFLLTTQSVANTINDLSRELDQVNKPGQAHIHRIRVDIKKLRAWIRLINDISGFGDLDVADRYLSDTSKQFSIRRDIEIIPVTINWLQGKSNKLEEITALQKISQHLYQEFPSSTNDDQYIAIDKKVLSELKQKSIKADLDKIYKDGLYRTNNKTMRFGNKAFSSKSTLKDLHRLRKWVKYFCYQIEFIQLSCPGFCKQEHSLLDKLGKRLGRIHDLVILREHVNKIKDIEFCQDAAKSTKKLISKRIKILRKRTEDIFREISTHSLDY